MDIKVIGMGCKDCDTLYANTVEAVRRLGLEIEPEKVEDLVEIVKLGVMQAPSLMIDGKLVAAGRVVKTAELEKMIQKYLH